MATISIIIPAFNRADMLPLTLESVLKQSFQDWECFVVDDLSTDNTQNVIFEYCKKDKRFHYLVNTRKKGAQGARNTGLYKSNGEWVVFFDSDNQMHPDMLERLFSAINPEIDVCKCFSSLIDLSTGKLVSIFDWVADGDIHRQLFDGQTYVDFNQEMIRRTKLLQIEGLDEDCPSLQEFDTNIRLSKICRYHTIQESLADCFIGNYEKISSNCSKQVKGRLYNLNKYKKEWLYNKDNAARMIYELYANLQENNSYWYRLKYIILLAVKFPEMIPYYVKKSLVKTRQES